jgi:uncharacterized protein (TIGR02147 family)
LELVHLKDFEPDHKWIAEKLNIPSRVAKDAVERLFRMELLVQGSKGQWFSSGNTYIPPSHVTAPSLQELQVQLLNKAINAVTSVELRKRDQSSIMMCTDSTKLAEAKERIKRFRRDLMKFLESSDKDAKDGVYCLTVSLFPVTDE